MDVRLYAGKRIDGSSQRLVSPDGTNFEVHRFRILGDLLVGRRQRLRECIIDTGAFLTLFPERIWGEFADDVEWLEPPEGVRLSDWCQTIAGIGGGRIACRIGRIRVAYVDFDLAMSKPIQLIAKFAEDAAQPADRQLKRIIVGLGGGTFDGRRLELNLDDGEAFLRETSVG